ncbi:MAG TPA: hypothetical protein VK849_10500, partial [Longimicrobiales bacterium]|nr:hypothetical protein [Longimicrobiales bacterium]
MPQDALHDLRLLVRSRHGLVVLDTPEEERAHALLRHVADGERLPFFGWTRAHGLARLDVTGTPRDSPSAVYDTKDPTTAFSHVASARQDA